MKKALLTLLALLMVLTQAGASAYQMTEAELRAIWAESCQRMNTTFDVGVCTLEDPSAQEMEMISSLPMAGDMPYDEALSYAKDLLNHRFEVPEETLDAMGVYPRLLDYLTTDMESEWDFLFSPLQNADVLADHPVDATGEYHVQFGARTGNPVTVQWLSTRLTDKELAFIAESAALAASGMEDEAFSTYYSPAIIHHFVQPWGVCVAFIYARTVDTPGGDNHVYQVQVDYTTGEVVKLEYTDGVG